VSRDDDVVVAVDVGEPDCVCCCSCSEPFAAAAAGEGAFRCREAGRVAIGARDLAARGARHSDPAPRFMRVFPC